MRWPVRCDAGERPSTAAKRRKKRSRSARSTNATAAVYRGEANQSPDASFHRSGQLRGYAGVPREDACGVIACCRRFPWNVWRTGAGTEVSCGRGSNPRREIAKADGTRDSVQVERDIDRRQTSTDQEPQANLAARSPSLRASTDRERTAARPETLPERLVESRADSARWQEQLGRARSALSAAVETQTPSMSGSTEVVSPTICASEFVPAAASRFRENVLQVFAVERPTHETPGCDRWIALACESKEVLRVFRISRHAPGGDIQQVCGGIGSVRDATGHHTRTIDHYDSHRPRGACLEQMRATITPLKPAPTTTIVCDGVMPIPRFAVGEIALYLCRVPRMDTSPFMRMRKTHLHFADEQ